MKPVETFFIAFDPLDGPPLPAPVIVAPKAPAHRIIAEVAAEHLLTSADLTGPSHKRMCVKPRHIAMTRIRNELGYSYPQIGKLFNRDHSSVIWAVRGGRKEHTPRKLGACGRRLAA